MQNKYAEVTPRNFNPMWAPGLSEDARKAVNAAFDAMSTWRIAGTATTVLRNCISAFPKIGRFPNGRPSAPTVSQTPTNWISMACEYLSEALA